MHGDSRQIIAASVALFGAFSWTCASVISRRTTVRISGFASAGWQMLFGGLFNTCVMFATGGLRGAKWGLQAWTATLYLVVFGSLVTYTAYIYLLNHVAVWKVATYAYVNPIIAVTLGAIFLHEAFVQSNTWGWQRFCWRCSWYKLEAQNRVGHTIVKTWWRRYRLRTRQYLLRKRSTVLRIWSRILCARMG